MNLRRIGITWMPSNSHGWGVFGLNLALTLIRNGPTTPMLFTKPMLIEPPSKVIDILAPFVEEQERLSADIQSNHELSFFKDTVLIHGLSDNFNHDEISNKVTGSHNVGFIFFENAAISDDAVKRSNKWDRILVGSNWNKQICEEAGIKNVRCTAQGIDIEIFRPIPTKKNDGERFVVFSGGKLELRKGQDLVLEAFRIFNKLYPDSVLVTSWQNHWPQTIAAILESPFINSLPSLNQNNKLDIVGWAEAHGVTRESIADTGWIPNSLIPEVLSHTDVALFPNRAEGGTNLAAMEAMACGIPCIISANTGHMDLINDENCYVLENQLKKPYSPDPSGHWRESSIDEILEKLEIAYHNAEDRKLRGERGASFMKNFSWDKQVEKIIVAIKDFL